ncbi:glycosyltransferase family 4 protein [Spirosoma endophyticum]|uniref:Glycosyltransferase involved in cell wall bisynthesis n=1 Tax=Spirosoma endophyticum TaxID=662367 RepID=A0A1I2CA01_9BACT|nr:glycosyltransferase family 4 protein [Spirosoma endophyticum]SFE65074.1 Glycosyltransferase involved in cell wall bisynthesis [Spirosoma endophyticum]
MRNVLLSAYACLPNAGSEEGNGWNYATLLSENGYRIHCLTKHQWQAAIDPVLANGFFPNLTVHYVPMPDWADKFCAKGLIGMYFHYLYWQWKAYKLGRKLDKMHDFDLVHHVTYGSIQLGSFLYKLKKPFIFGPVGGGQRAPQALKRYFGQYWSREWMRDWVSIFLQYANPGFYQTLKTASRVIVTNDDTYQLAKSQRPNKPIERMLDAGLSASFLPSEPIERQASTTMNLLWVGRLMPRKALELTIQAFSKVNPALPITLTIVGGKGEMVDQVPGYISRYGVQDRVKWAGHVSYDEVKEFYRQSDVFVFTSLRDSCPMQLLEAMAYSLPVVTLELHGQAELVSPETGLKVTVSDEDQVTAELAKAIEWMFAHPDQRLAMGRAAYTFAQSQVWDAKIRTFIDDLYPAVMALEAPAERADVIPANPLNRHRS